MPRKLALEPLQLKRRVKQLQKKYRLHILEDVRCLYFYCFYERHSEGMQFLLKKLRKEHPKVDFPFLKKGTREWGMIYVYLLAQLLRKNQSKVWDDVVFIIYLTFYTGLLFDTDEDINFDSLSKIMNEDGMAKPVFKSSFRYIQRYNFKAEKISLNNAQIKRKLIEKEASFKKKFHPEVVELFEKYSLKIIKKHDLTI
jgi:hypothetical protein